MSEETFFQNVKKHMRSRGLHGGHLGVEIFPSKNEEDPNNIFYMDCYYFSSIHTHTYTLTGEALKVPSHHIQQCMLFQPSYRIRSTIWGFCRLLFSCNNRG